MKVSEVCFFALQLAVVGAAPLSSDPPRGWRVGGWLPHSKETVELAVLQPLELCASSPIHLHCLQYNLNSSRLLESFVVDKSVYENSRGEDVRDLKYVEGSHCLGEQCEKRVELNFVDWCLIAINVDPLLRTAHVEYKYGVCLSGRDKDHAIIVLASTAGALLTALFLCCICWCKYSSQKRRRSDSIPISYNDQDPLVPENGKKYVHHH